MLLKNLHGERGEKTKLKKKSVHHCLGKHKNRNEISVYDDVTGQE